MKHTQKYTCSNGSCKHLMKELSHTQRRTVATDDGWMRLAAPNHLLRHLFLS
jgi:hypothetical protein